MLPYQHSSQSVRVFASLKLVDKAIQACRKKSLKKKCFPVFFDIFFVHVNIDEALTMRALISNIYTKCYQQQPLGIQQSHINAKNTMSIQMTEEELMCTEIVSDKYVS